MRFTDLNLNSPLLNALDDLGYQTPTSIQQKVFFVIISVDLHLNNIFRFYQKIF